MRCWPWRMLPLATALPALDPSWLRLALLLTGETQERPLAERLLPPIQSCCCCCCCCWRWCCAIMDSAAAMSGRGIALLISACSPAQHHHGTIQHSAAHQNVWSSRNEAGTASMVSTFFTLFSSLVPSALPVWFPPYIRPEPHPCPSAILPLPSINTTPPSSPTRQQASQRPVLPACAPTFFPKSAT